MKNALWLVLIGFIVGAFVMYANIQFARTQRTSSTISINSTVSPTQALSPIEPTPGQDESFIEGTFSYPSEGIPDDLVACVEGVTVKQPTCTDQHISLEPNASVADDFRIAVPPGSYYVYAYRPSDPSYKAYYSEFVTCGLSVNCPSHDPITVEVAAGQTVKNIKPHDWYNSPTLKP